MTTNEHREAVSFINYKLFKTTRCGKMWAERGGEGEGLNEGERLGVIASSPGHFQGEWPGSEARDEGEG